MKYFMIEELRGCKGGGVLIVLIVLIVGLSLMLILVSR